MTKNEAMKIIEAYDALVDRVVEITSIPGHYHSFDHDSCARLSIDGNEVVVEWKEYESDYYGGGSLREENARFPIDLLLLDDKELQKFASRVKKEEAEKAARLRAAHEAVARDRREAHDRAEWARLRAKYSE